MATATLNPGLSYQEIIGWQVSGEVGQTDYPVSVQNYKTAAVQAAVDFGWNRIRVGSHSGIENTTDYWQLWIDANSDVPHAARTTWAANRNVPVNDNADPNSINAAGFQFGQIAWVMNQVAVPMKAALALRGESLFIVHTYVHFSLSNKLHITTASEYGEYILAVWNYYQTTYGYVPDALEIFLEPDNPSAQVTTGQMAAMIVAARDRLVAGGHAKPYFIAPSTLDGFNAESYYDSVKAANANAGTYIDEIGYHRYGAPDLTQLASLRTKAVADGKNTAMTEFDQATVHHLFDDLNTGKVSAWERYSICYPSATNTLFDIGAGPGYAITPRAEAKYLRHFTQFIRAGAVMKGVSIGGTGSGNAVPLFFQNTNGSQVVVFKCTGALDIVVSGMSAGNIKVVYTTGDGSSAPSAHWQFLADVAGGADTASRSMPGAGFITFYHENYLDQPVSQVTGSPRAKKMMLFG